MKNSLSLFLFSYLLKIPFLNLGYGPEEDSWGHVQNIWEMKEAGHYIMSRLPGHPVYEALLYLLWSFHSPLIYNSISAIAAGLAVVAFYKLAKHYNIAHAYYISAAFMFVPTFFLSGTYTIDYTLGLALSLWAFYAVLKNKVLLAALLLAMATGTRITWILMLFPMLAALNGYRPDKFKFKESLVLLFTFAMFTALAYSIVYNTYGIYFFSTYSLPYPPLAKAIYKGTFGVWGLLGTIALFGLSIFFVIRFKFYLKQLRWRHIVWLMPIVMYSLIYLRLPEKSAFFIPVIPFLLLLIFSLASEKVSKWSAVIMGLSLIFLGINISDPLRGSSAKAHDLKKTISGQEIFLSFERGLYFLELSKRENKIKATDRFQNALRKIEKPTVVICGWWYAMIDITVKDNNLDWPENVKIHYFLSDEEILEYQENGYELLYLPEQEIVNNRKNNSTLTTELGELLAP
ncbi:MAG: hypothetical protein N4A46_10050 [Schleiferiaceae bacterium]|nr:hypothetical protein [Schleiferiaceae bacterium]